MDMKIVLKLVLGNFLLITLDYLKSTTLYIQQIMDYSFKKVFIESKKYLYSDSIDKNVVLFFCCFLNF